MARKLELVALGLCAVLSGSVIWIYFKRRKACSTKAGKLPSLNSVERCRAKAAESDLSSVDAAEILTLNEAEILSRLIGGRCSSELKQRALITIANKAAFTKNQETLREAGCLDELSRLLISNETNSSSVDFSKSTSDLLRSTLIAVNNLAMNETNQRHLQHLTPTLLNYVSAPSVDLDLRLSALKVLVNLTCTCDYNGLTFPDVDKVVSLACSNEASAEVKLHSTKLLVNLSNNPDLISCILDTKVYEHLLNKLNRDLPEEFLLRWLVILRNIVGHEVESERLFRLLSDSNDLGPFQQKLSQLAFHANDEIKHHAVYIASVFRKRHLVELSPYLFECKE